MSYKPLENVTIVFSTANITVCADEWGDLYYTTEIPDEFVNQGEPYPRSKYDRQRFVPPNAARSTVCHCHYRPKAETYAT